MHLAYNNLTKAIENLHIYLDNPMPVEEFLSIPAEDIVYKISVDDQVIGKLIKTFKLVNLTCNDLEEEDNKVNKYIKAIRKIEKFFKKKIVLATAKQN
ncbi:6558_t:CDS:2 [Dentiscutata heterogama]|uniref:6558_t:CDS:1 n=1 Tax=Dentiscutata heterogama TaxID=1316150 RepID=A0ACA9K567_9GLOM|nr:6558_t:CDS:2 [Dentiscutata heterogama]